METKNYNKLFSGIIIVLVLINIFTLAFLWYSFGKRPSLPPPIQHIGEMDRKPPMTDFIARELKFDATQGKKLEDILYNHHKNVETIQDSIRTLKDEISKEISSATPDENKIKSIARSIGDLQSNIEMARYEHFQNIKALCNADQLKLFDEMIKNLMTHQNQEPHPVVPPDKMMPPDGRPVPPPVNGHIPPPPPRDN